MENWRELFFDKSLCSGVITPKGDGNIVVTGKLKNINRATITYFAANPPDVNTLSFTGRGLPFPNPDIAFQNTENVGRITTEDGTFRVSIKYPNSYYTALGSLYVPPQLHIKICEPGFEKELMTVNLGNGIPYRTLTHPAPPSKNNRTSPLFYTNPQMPIRSQEKVLRDSGYPEFGVVPPKMPNNFWGLRPPN